MTPQGHRIFTTRSAFHDALRAAFAGIAEHGCREVWICDTDFTDWPLSEIAVIESLTRWAYSHRKLTVLAQQFEDLQRRHPRWVEWRRQWSHVVECRGLDELEPGAVPSLFLAPGAVTVRLFDPVHHRGSISHELADAIRCRDLVDAVSQRSSEAFPVTTLGL